MLGEVAKVLGGSVGSRVLVISVMVPTVYVRPVKLLCVGVLWVAGLDKVDFTRVDVSGPCEEKVSTEEIILRLEYPSFYRGNVIDFPKIYTFHLAS